MNAHQADAHKHPFSELIPVLTAAMLDSIPSKEERQDILRLCDRLRSSAYYDLVTVDLQRLHAILGGIAADGINSKDELEGLSKWLQEHDYLRKCWPYDEVDSVVTSVLADQRIDADEHEMLNTFFSEFITLLDDRTITDPLVSHNDSVSGVCAVCPEITFEDSVFCFTEASSVYTRSSFIDVVESLGGQAVASVSKKINYLIIGAEGNPCWAYACYGRKVEKAVQLRKQGQKLVIVHENDFHDAVADL